MKILLRKLTTTKKHKSKKVYINDPMIKVAQQQALRDIILYYKSLPKEKPIKMWEEKRSVKIGNNIYNYNERELGKMVWEQKDVERRGYKLI